MGMIVFLEKCFRILLFQKRPVEGIAKPFMVAAEVTARGLREVARQNCVDEWWPYCKDSICDMIINWQVPVLLFIIFHV